MYKTQWRCFQCIFQCIKSSNGLLSRIYKEILQINKKKKTNNPTGKWAYIRNKNFSEKEAKGPKNTIAKIETDTEAKRADCGLPEHGKCRGRGDKGEAVNYDWQSQNGHGGVKYSTEDIVVKEKILASNQEMQTVTMTFHFISVRLTMAKSIIPTLEDVEKWKFSYTANDYKLAQSLWRTILNYLAQLTMSMPKDLTILLLDVYLGESFLHYPQESIYKDTLVRTVYRRNKYIFKALIRKWKIMWYTNRMGYT